MVEILEQFGVCELVEKKAAEGTSTALGCFT